VAKIRSWSETTSERASKRLTEAEATWSLESGPEGARILVIRTFGSDSRQDAGTPSQVIHLDKKSAAELLAIIVASLPALD
jgi:hypothetical protein